MSALTKAGIAIGVALSAALVSAHAQNISVSAGAPGREAVVSTPVENRIATELPKAPDLATALFVVQELPFIADDLNNNTEIVGSMGFGNSTNAFFWTKGTTYPLNGYRFEYNGGTALNDSSQFVAIQSASTPNAALFTYDGTSILSSQAFHGITLHGVNNQGWLLGARPTDLDHYAAWGSSYEGQHFIMKNGLEQTIGLPAGNDGGAALYALNDAGEVVGGANRKPDYASQAVYVGADLKWHWLPNYGRNRFSEAYSINRHGEIVGTGDALWSSASYALLWEKGATTEFKVLEPISRPDFFDFAWGASINRWGQIVGHNYNGAALWVNQKLVDLSGKLLNADGITLGYFFKINDKGEIIGDGYPGNTFLLTPIWPSLAVDANRDGTIKLRTDDDSDATSVEKPFRFWLNDDIDRGHTVDDTDHEEDDISPAEAAANNWQPDWTNDYIKSKRDLEDFTRLWISTSGINDSIRNGQLFLGLKWTDITGTPAIKLYPHVDPDGGTKYLTDDSMAQQQLDGILGVVLSHAIPDERDDARDGPHTVIEGDGVVFVLPTFLFYNLTEAKPKTYLLFEGCKAGKGQLKLVILKKDGTNYTEIGDGGGVWLDLKKIGDMYEHWSVGNGSGATPDQVAGRVASETGSGSAFSYTSSSPEEQKYILFVHGWNMEKWEKERFAETAYKRLYWQGYKGRFGLFSWPTTNNFGSEMSAILDSTNFDRGEFSGWRSAAPLRQLLQTLNSAYGGELYVLSHSMGGVVTSEALRLQSDANGGRIAKVYVASQAALSAHAYDSTLSDAVGSSNALQWNYNHPQVPNGTQNYGPQTANVYKNWTAFVLNGSAVSSSAVGTLVNFYNENDWALSAPVWQFNQITKPDFADAPNLLWEYYYVGDFTGVPLNDGFRKVGKYTNLSGEVILGLGNRTTLQDRYEIMSFDSESRVKAFGATPNISQGISGAVNLRSSAIWPADPDNHSAHKWHSGEFRSTIQRQRNYWKALLSTDAFNIPTTTLP